MPTIFEDGFAYLADVLEAQAGVMVTLTRNVGGLVYTCDTVAVLGRTIFSRARPSDGAPAIEYGDGDWLIRKDVYDLGPAGEAVEPAEGDRILDQVTGRLYEIRPLVNEPAWRWSEPEKLTYRIHSTEIQEDGP